MAHLRVQGLPQALLTAVLTLALISIATGGAVTAPAAAAAGSMRVNYDPDPPWDVDPSGPGYEGNIPGGGGGGSPDSGGGGHRPGSGGGGGGGGGGNDECSNELDPLGNGACYTPECTDPQGCDYFQQQPAPQAQGPTPQELAQRAHALLPLPKPAVSTAPPRGTPGLVGLPQWVWLPRDQWTPLKKRLSAGGTWAEVTATPQRMIVQPGAGLPAVVCPGPGTPYDRTKPASAQRTDCSYTFQASSAHQPGGTYTVTVSVVWGATWVGSGGTGGALPDLTVSASFPLPIAESQALN